MKRELLKKFKQTGLKGNALKDYIQNYAVDEWIRMGCKGYITFFTGFGKTNTALLSARRFFDKYEGNIITLVPTTKLVKQWTKKIEKWNLPNIDTYVINSYTMNLADPNIKRSGDILFADELHRICNDQSKYFSKALDITTYEMFLGLSATLDKTHKVFLAKYGIYEVFEITIEEGLELGLVPEHDIYNIACEISEEEEAVYDKWNGLYQRKLKWFSAIAPYDDTSLVVACTKAKGYSSVRIGDTKVKKTNLEWIKLVAQHYNIEENDVKVNANIWRTAMSGRNICLQKVKSKHDLTVYILNEKLKGETTKKAIVFVESVEEANSIAEATSATAIHSKVSLKKREQLLEAFEEGDCDQVVTVKALDEGYDNEDLEYGIAKHFTSVSRSFKQRLGRTLRFSERNPNKHPKYLSLYTVSKRNPDKVFQDKIQLMQAQRGIIGTKWVKSVEDVPL